MVYQENGIGDEDTKSVMSSLLMCLMKPLEYFRKEHDQGEALFQYLFYDREKGRKSIQDYIHSMKNITIIGNPGQGKSSLLHYMFIELNKSKKIYFQ